MRYDSQTLLSWNLYIYFNTRCVMKYFFRRYQYALITVMLISLLVGAYLSYEYYYYSSFEYKYWFLCVVLIILAITSKFYTKAITKQQTLVLIPIILIYFISWFLIPHFLRLGIFLFATICFLYAGVIIFNSRFVLARIIFIGAFAISSLNLSAILFYLTERSMITRPIINSVFISNSKEMNEYFWGKLSIYHFTTVALFLFFAIILLYKKAKAKSEISFQILLLFFLSFILSSFSGPLGAFSTEYVLYRQNKESLKKMVEARERGLIENNFSIDENNGPDKIMVIIGESLTSDYMSLYGYEKDTNPELIKLSLDTAHGRLLIFEDVITPEVNTVPALRKVLTNINNRNNISFEKSVTIMDLFEKAGYKTLWYSNQLPLGKHDTPTSVIASSANKVYFTAFQDSIKNNKISLGEYYDDYLLGVLKEDLKETTHLKKLYFVHLEGSHWNYADRYPPNFNVFKTADNHLNQYLNSVLYNDWVVANLMKLAQKNKVDIVYYFSDHGEDLAYGHNQEKFSPGMARIPFLVYFSNDYVVKNSKHYQGILKKIKAAGMTDNFFHDIQAISGVKSSLFEPKESFVTEQYIKITRSVVDNRFTYD